MGRMRISEDAALLDGVRHYLLTFTFNLISRRLGTFTLTASKLYARESTKS